MKKPLKYLIIHCTDTPEGRIVTSADIRKWHTSPKPVGNGWKQVGYTDMFLLNGGVERLVDNNEDANVDTWEVTNGASGYNSISRHVVYVGGTDKKNLSIKKDTRTTEQKKAMRDYVINFLKRFPHVQVGGHCQFNKLKACPSFDVPNWLRSIGVAEKNIYKE